MTYRSRYRTAPQAMLMFDHLVMDESNLRSIAYQLSQRVEHLEVLPDLPGVFRPSDLSAGWLRQRCVRHTLNISPHPATWTQQLDPFGNSWVFFVIQEPHTQ